MMLTGFALPLACGSVFPRALKMSAPRPGDFDGASSPFCGVDGEWVGGFGPAVGFAAGSRAIAPGLAEIGPVCMSGGP